MSPEDIATYRANYDLAAWERITNGWRLHVAPPGAILAINALCDEVERLRDDAERWRLQNEVVGPLRERVKELEDALRGLLSGEDAESTLESYTAASEAARAALGDKKGTP